MNVKFVTIGSGVGWEIVDEDVVYLRSDEIFPTESDARENLRISSHLISAHLTFH